MNQLALKAIALMALLTPALGIEQAPDELTPVDLVVAQASVERGKSFSTVPSSARNREAAHPVIPTAADWRGQPPTRING
jgi:hypothetical protein